VCKTSNQERKIALGRCLQLLTDESMVEDDQVKDRLHVLDVELQIVAAETINAVFGSQID
jgi:hypothetical protein